MTKPQAVTRIDEAMVDLQAAMAATTGRAMKAHLLHAMAALAWISDELDDTPGELEQ